VKDPAYLRKGIAVTSVCAGRLPVADSRI